MTKSNWMIVFVTAIAVVVLIVLPVAAIGALTGDDATSPDASSEIATSDEDVVVGATVQEMTRRRMQVHAETGPPEDFEPLQQRLHIQERDAGQGSGQGQGQGQGFGYGRGQGMATGYGGGGQGMGALQEPGWLSQLDD